MSHKQFLLVCNSVEIIKAYFLALQLDLGASRLLRARGYYVLGFVGGGGGSFSEKEALPRGLFYEKWYKEIFSCYVSEKIGARYNINFSES